MSGLGFLLLIPVMIIIPIFLAVETQSSDIPNKMVSSDTTYRVYEDIRNDIRNNVFAFGSAVENKTYQSGESGNIAGSITKLYKTVDASNYQSAFGNTKISINPNYSPQSFSNWNSTGGTANLNNGVIISYNNITSPYLDPNTGKYFCNYVISVQTNMTIVVNMENGNNGHSQPYAETYIYRFRVNSNTNDNNTAIISLNDFFSSIGNSIKSYT